MAGVTNLVGYNQASVSADADLLKKQATARYAFDTGMASSQKQLTLDLGQQFRTAELGFHNANTALMVDQATAPGIFSLAQANQQLAGAEKLHQQLDLPYTQFLVDRATADADFAFEARQSLINHALNINDAGNIRITADQLAYSITESANANAVQGHANTVASSLSSGTKAIAGSLQTSGTQLATAIQSYQQAEAQIQATHRTTVQQAQRQFQHDEDTAARDAAITTANETRDDALKTLRETYVTQEITPDGGRQDVPRYRQAGSSRSLAGFDDRVNQSAGRVDPQAITNSFGGEREWRKRSLLRLLDRDYACLSARGDNPLPCGPSRTSRLSWTELTVESRWARVASQKRPDRYRRASGLFCRQIEFASHTAYSQSFSPRRLLQPS